MLKIRQIDTIAARAAEIARDKTSGLALKRLASGARRKLSGIARMKPLGAIVMAAVAVILAAAIIAAMSGSASAQSRPPCGERAKVVERLQGKYGESRQGLGLQRENGVVEIYASARTGSWTITITLPTGLTCLIAAGENWQRTEEVAAADPDA